MVQRKNTYHCWPLECGEKAPAYLRHISKERQKTNRSIYPSCSCVRRVVMKTSLGGQELPKGKCPPPLPRYPSTMAHLCSLKRDRKLATKSCRVFLRYSVILQPIGNIFWRRILTRKSKFSQHHLELYNVCDQM